LLVEIIYKKELKKMATVPDEAVDNLHEVSTSAFNLFVYYCRKRNRDTGGWKCPNKATSLATNMSRSRVSELRHELTTEGWIRVEENDFIVPLKGFKPVEISTPQAQPSVEISTDECRDFDSSTVQSVEISTASVEVSTGSVEISTPPHTPPIRNTSTLTSTLTPEEKTLVEDKPPPVAVAEDFSPAHKPSPKVQAKEIFDYWVKAMKKPKAQFTPEREKKVLGRLKRYTIEQIKQAIDGCRSSAFNRGDNDRGKPFNDLELICRTDTKLETFIEMAPKRITPRPVIVQPTANNPSVPAKKDFGFPAGIKPWSPSQIARDV
jgi:hypothetical protein